MLQRGLKPFEVLALGVVAVLVLLVVYFAAQLVRAQIQVAQKISALRAAGEPVELIDLAPNTLAPEINAAVFLRRTKKDVDAIQLAVEATEQSLSKAEQQSFSMGQPSPAMVEALRAAFDAHPDAIILLAQAAKCSDYGPRVSRTSDTQLFTQQILASLTPMRAAIRVLNYRLQLSLAESKPHDALATCLIMLRLARHFDREPMIISYLVTNAVRGVALQSAEQILRSEPLPIADSEALERELAQHDLKASFLHALRTERAFGLESFAQLPWSPFLKSDQNSYLDLMAAEIAEVSPANSSPNQLDPQAAVANAGAMTKLLAPTIQAVQGATMRTLAELRCLRVLNALLRTEQQRGAGPLKMTDLGLPADVVLDPYNDRPLKIKKTPRGWLVVSAGGKTASTIVSESNTEPDAPVKLLEATKSADPGD